MSPNLKWPLANFVALAATVIVNGLANALPLNGQTTGEIIDRDPVYFLPAGWAFSIWGVIYLALTGFVVYGLLPVGRQNQRLQRISPFFVLSCAANITWLFLWHWERLPLSMVAMAVLLLSLIAIYLGLRRDGPMPSLTERLTLWFPFSIYLGWVSVATIANASVTLDREGWDGWGIAPPNWAAIMIVVGGLLATVIGLYRSDAAYTAVFVWAFVAIAVRQQDTTLVAVTAAIVALAAAVVTGIALIRQWRQGWLLSGKPPSQAFPVS